MRRMTARRRHQKTVGVFDEVRKQISDIRRCERGTNQMQSGLTPTAVRLLAVICLLFLAELSL